MEAWIIKIGNLYLAYDAYDDMYLTPFLYSAEIYTDRRILDMDLKTYGGKAIRIKIEECEE